MAPFYGWGSTASRLQPPRGGSLLFTIPLKLINDIQRCNYTAQKMKLSIKDLFTKCDQIGRKLWIWVHLLNKFLMENFHFLCRIQNLSFIYDGTISEYSSR